MPHKTSLEIDYSNNWERRKVNYPSADRVKPHFDFIDFFDLNRVSNYSGVFDEDEKAFQTNVDSFYEFATKRFQSNYKDELEKEIIEFKQQFYGGILWPFIKGLEDNEPLLYDFMFILKTFKKPWNI